jgi:hypothetical protein
VTSSPVQTASAKQTLLVFAGMVLSIWLAWTIRARVLETPQLPADGPLKPFVIAQTAAPACVAPGCNLVLDYPRPGQVVRVQAAQLQLPEVRLISAEPGYAFVPQSPPLLYVVPMDLPRLPFVEMRLPLDDAAPNPRAPGVDTGQPGWVVAGRDLASGAMIDFDGAGSLPAAAPRASAGPSRRRRAARTAGRSPWNWSCARSSGAHGSWRSCATTRPSGSPTHGCARPTG